MRTLRSLSFLMIMSLVFGMMQGAWAQDNVQTKPLHVLGNRIGLADFAWSPDGATLAVSTYAGVVLYDARLNEIGFLEPTGDVPFTSGLAWSPDGTQLFAGNGPVRLWQGFFTGSHTYIWDVATGETVQRLALNEGVGVHTQGWNHGGNTVLMMVGTQSEVTSLMLWNAETGDVQEIDITALGLRSDAQWTWSDDDLSLETVVEDQKITIAVDNSTEINQETITAPTTAFDSPDGQHSVTHEDGVFVVSTATGDTIELRSDETGRFKGYRDIVWAEASNRVVAWGRGGVPNLMVGDVLTGSTSWQFTYDYTGTVLDAKFAPDGSVLAILASINELFVYDFELEELHHLKFNSAATSLSFNPDGSKVASVTGSSQQVYIWDTATGDLLDTWETSNDPKGEPSYIFSVAWSPDGNYVATGSIRGGETDGVRESRSIDLFIWSVGTGEVIQTVPALAYDFDIIAELDWSADSQVLAYTTHSNQYGVAHIGAYNLETQELLFQAPLEVGVWDIALHPEGNVLALTALDLDDISSQQILFIDAQNGELLDVSTPGIDATLRSIDWHPSGDYLAALVDRDDLFGDSDSRLVQIWSWQTDTPLGFYMYFDLAGGSGQSSLEWNDQGTQLATWHFGEENDFGVQIWDISLDEQTANMNTVFLPDYPEYYLLSPNFDALDWSSDGSMIATSLSTVTSSIWEVPVE